MKHPGPDATGLTRTVYSRYAVQGRIVTTSKLSLRLPIFVAIVLTLLAELSVIADEQPAASDQSVRLAESATPGAQARAKGAKVPGPPALEPQDPRVLFITAPDCDQCFRELIKLRRPGGDFDAMRSRGWRIGSGDHNHVQVVERDAVSELIKDANIREFPAVVCISEGKVVRGFTSGCTTPLDSWTLGWLFNGKNERPAGFVSEPVRVEATGSYRLRGNHWSVDGDWNPARSVVLTHLRSPSHGYQVAVNYRLETWSYEELRSLHDDLHEQELANSPFVRSPSASGADNYSAGRKLMGR